MRAVAIAVAAVVATLLVQRAWTAAQPAPVVQAAPTATETPIATPTPTPAREGAALSPAPTAAPTPTPRPPFVELNARELVVALAAEPGRRDDLTAAFTRLPAAWSEATRGRSRLTVTGGITTDFAPVYVYFVDLSATDGEYQKNGSLKRIAAGRIHVIDVYRLGPDGDPVLTVLHELAHVLGCCVGAGTIDRHWEVCRNEIMCHDGSRGSRVFSDRELEQMRLGS